MSGFFETVYNDS